MSRHSTTNYVSTLISNLRIKEADHEHGEQSKDTQTATTVETMDEQCADSQSRSTPLQEQSRLLSLPTELRLHICSHMTLSPATLDWTGAFFSCYRIHHDMLKQLPPITEMENCLQRIVATQAESSNISPSQLVPGHPHPLFGWVRNVTLKLLISDGWQGIIPRLYALHLDTLQIHLMSDNEALRTSRSISVPYGDLKSLCPPDLWDSKASVTMNCKKITLTFDKLAKADGARAKETSYNLTLPGTDIVYLFTVVQNKEEKQVERSYTFNNRFKLPVVQTEQEREETSAGWCIVI